MYYESLNRAAQVCRSIHKSRVHIFGIFGSLPLYLTLILNKDYVVKRPTTPPTHVVYECPLFPKSLASNEFSGQFYLFKINAQKLFYFFLFMVYNKNIGNNSSPKKYNCVVNETTCIVLSTKLIFYKVVNNLNSPILFYNLYCIYVS